MIGLKKKSKAKKNAALQSSGEVKSDDGDNSSGKIGNLLDNTGSRKKTTKKKSKRVPAVVLRLQKDVQELDGGEVAKVTFPDTQNLKIMNCSITPDNGFWEGATYNFTIDVPDDYPHKAPLCTLKEKIYHPNIDLEGKVCINILRADWKPVLDINAVIYGLIFLLNTPNGNDPLNKEAARHFRENPTSFKEAVRTSLRGGTVRFGGKTISGFPRLV